jgi:hypothetical protein
LKLHSGKIGVQRGIEVIGEGAEVIREMWLIRDDADANDAGPNGRCVGCTY